jgi:peptide/nickel transport system ATP-binding protein
MPLVEVRKLVKIYPMSESVFGGKPRPGVRAVDGVSLDIDAGETLGLVGESGCGKSTLGRLILRLIEPTSGWIGFDGRDVTVARDHELRTLRREMQIIFQDPFGSLDPRMNIEHIITEPILIHEGLSHSARRTRAAELMKAVGMDESALGRYPHEFSGGQRQRIGIARALAVRPKFIVADEPVSALDVSVGAQIINLMKRLQKDFGLTYLFISHSMPLVRYISDRIAVMTQGKIVEVGTTEQVTTLPRHSYTKTLLDSVPEVEVTPSHSSMFGQGFC